MLTADRLLKFVSGALLGAFILFSLIVTIRELMRSRDPLNRLVSEHCLTLAAFGSDAPPGAQFLPRAPATPEELTGNGAACLFFDASARDATPLTQALFKRTPVSGWDHLYLGPRGALLIRDERTFAAEAELLRSCLRDRACAAGDTGLANRSVTLSLVDAAGRRPVNLSFYDEALGDILAKMPGLLNEMSTVKKIDPAALTLETAFHRHYALLAQPDEPSVATLAAPGRDGLMIASRGPKIRLLPWEYGKNPLRRLMAKGSQYGLDKDEYKKDNAAVTIFATVRFREEKGAMREIVPGPEAAADGR